jgi:hypothetical protein
MSYPDGGRLPAFASLAFRLPSHKYQRMVLDIVEREAARDLADRRHHIVAAPGSGNTIVGVELICRFGRLAVVFTPTTTIQQQGQEKLGLFTSDVGWVAQHRSLHLTRLPDITILTFSETATTATSRTKGHGVVTLLEVSWKWSIVATRVGGLGTAVPCTGLGAADRLECERGGSRAAGCAGGLGSRALRVTGDSPDAPPGTLRASLTKHHGPLILSRRRR